MKTTIEIPDPLFRRAKARAAERGQSLKELFNEALQQKLAEESGSGGELTPRWMQGFGTLGHLHSETKKIQSRIDQTFRMVEAEDRD